MSVLPDIVERPHHGWDKLPESWPDSLRKIMAARGITAVEQLYFELADLPRPDQLLGMQAAVELLATALKEQWKVTIVADFDSDGATSCALAIRGLQSMGLKQVHYIVPNRFIHGYGLTPSLLEDIPAHEQPDLLVTVDNGIASISGVKAAHQRGMKVLVTDHHLAGEELPEADAIVNPNQTDDPFPYKNLAGVGVCFYVLLGLRQHLRTTGWFESAALPEPKVGDWLDLVALGTVADVVPLDKLNRTLVNHGLQRIRRGKGCIGIQALIRIAGREKEKLVSSDLGFSIAPRLNAAGRMEDMGLGINLLLTDNADQALSIATQLDSINLERRAVEQTMQVDALKMLEQIDIEDNTLRTGYCLFNEDWHQGVIGLLASRIKEKTYRPVIAFAPGNDDEVKGSARSIPGIHIRDVLARVAAKHPKLLERFGGHAMAAGLTIKKADLNEFNRAFESALNEMVSTETYLQQLPSDGELAASDCQLSFAEILSEAAPWGQGFEEPRFHGVFKVNHFRLVGQEQNHLRLQLEMNGNRQVNAMAFGQDKPSWLDENSLVLVRYKLSVNEFRGQKTLQFLVDELMPANTDTHN